MEPNLKETRDIRVPVGFKRELKDLVDPIIVRRQMLWRAGIGLIVLILLAGAAWYAFLRAPTGPELLAEAVDAAGGMEAWRAVDGGSYVRVHTVYDENEEPVRVVEERHAFLFGNDGGIVMETSGDGGNARIGRDSGGYWASLNGEAQDPVVLAQEMNMMCESDMCTPTCSMELSFYRFSMPFKLTDPGVIPTYGGETALAGRAAHLLHIGFEEGVGSDRWTLYIDDESKLVRKIDYYENADLDAVDTPPVEVHWGEHRKVGDLVISHRQTYYRTNGTLLEDYVIKDVDLTNPVPAERITRPAGLQMAAVTGR